MWDYHTSKRQKDGLVSRTRVSYQKLRLFILLNIKTFFLYHRIHYWHQEIELFMIRKWYLNIKMSLSPFHSEHSIRNINEGEQWSLVPQRTYFNHDSKNPIDLKSIRHCRVGLMSYRCRSSEPLIQNCSLRSMWKGVIVGRRALNLLPWRRTC